MARRGGFLSRLGKVLGNLAEGLTDLFKAPDEESGPPRRPPGPPPPRPPVEPPFENREQQIWRDTAHGMDRYDQDLFAEWENLYRDSVEPLEMDERDYLKYWREFLQAYYLVSGERGSVSRDKFHRDIGIRKRDWEMDWSEWRAIKRGTP